MMNRKSVLAAFTLVFLMIPFALFAAEKEIKIGVLYPLSGAAATIGRDLN